MKLLRANSLTFTSYGEGSYDDDGLWVAGAETSFVAKGSLQPHNLGASRQVLPEGVTETDAKKFFTKDRVLTANSLTNEQAFETIINGFPYVTIASGDWVETGLSLDHYSVILARKDKNEDLT